MLASVSSPAGIREARRQPGGPPATRRLGAARRTEGEEAAHPEPGQRVSEIELLRALEGHCAGHNATEDNRGGQGIEGRKPGPARTTNGVKDGAHRLTAATENKYYWELGRTLGQELLHRRERGREATVGAQNFRDSERRAQSRLFSQHGLSNPSRFYREAAQHPEGDIIASISLALRKKMVLLGAMQ